jgi:hypothetical protein
VVFAVLDDEAVVTGRQLGVESAGLLCSVEQRLPQAGVALLGDAGSGVAEAGAVCGGARRPRTTGAEERLLKR